MGDRILEARAALAVGAVWCLVGLELFMIGLLVENPFFVGVGFVVYMLCVYSAVTGWVQLGHEAKRASRV